MTYKRKPDIMFNPPHPGEVLREECIKPLGMTIKEAAFKLGITRQSLSDIVNCHASISVAMALKLAKVPGVTKHKESAECDAAKLYLSGTTSSSYDWYCDKVLYWADHYEDRL